MRQLFAFAAMACFLLVSSCTSSAPGGQHATVHMRDGSDVSGTVTASSPTEITLAGDDKSAHKIPMSQVKSVEYDETPQTAAAPATGSTETPAPATAPAPASAPPEESHANHYHPPESTVSTKTYQLPVGTKISVRLEETIDSSKEAEGQTYAAEVTGDVLDRDGAVVIPRGSNAKVVIKSATRGGKITGASDLVLDLRAVSVEGQEYLIGASDLQQHGKEGVGANKRTAVFTGTGAAIGAIIGAIAGGGKGAAIGAASGAGAGVATQIVTKGSAIKVPAETILTFKLDRALRVTAG
jgi:hypothetical protein